METKPPVALTIGNFDGLHLGHQSLIQKTFDLAKKNKFLSAICVFEPHTDLVLSKNFLGRIFATSELKSELKSCGFDICFVQNFTKDIAFMSAKDFLQNIILKQFNLKDLIVGYDFVFGKKRQGDFHFLKEQGKIFGFSVTQCPPYLFEGEKVSSSRIRKNILNKNFLDVTKMMGQNFFIESQIEKGLGLGSKIGFPTANLNILEDKILPPFGVYLCKALYFNKKSYALVNLGQSPTVSQNEKKLRLEAHIFNENHNLLGQVLRLEFLEFLRPERAFSSLDALKVQIQKDKDWALSKIS